MRFSLLGNTFLSLTGRDLIGRRLCTHLKSYSTVRTQLHLRMSSITEKSSVKCFNGTQKVYTHQSEETKTEMTFGVYLPPQAESGKCPVVYYLSGLTCTEQNFVTKAGAQKAASELGLILVAPDTSPRGANIEGEEESWDFGTGAGFYVDATEEKWKNNYRMYSYVTKELPAIVHKNFPVNGKAAITGHSMGGHGALICALKNPGMFCAVSAFAPICNPVKCPWGEKAFTGYLGTNIETWKEYDACELSKKYNGPPLSILADQGTADGFLEKKQLLPDNLIEATKDNSSLACTVRMQEGYDHSYYFIATFIEEHLRFLNRGLTA